LNPPRAGRSLFSLRRMLAPVSHSTVWEKYALGGPPSAALRRLTPEQTRYSALPRPNRFRLALEEAGGLFTLFGQFLSGRADLLPSDYLGPLRSIRVRRNESLSPTSVPEIRDRIVQGEWLRTAPCSEIYAATFQERPVVTEIFLPAEAVGSEPEFQQLERQLRLLKHSVEAAIGSPLVLGQFREWLALEADVERKRTMLRNLQDIPFPCVSRFPRLVPELQSARCLAYERVEGSSLAEALSSETEAAAALDRWSESWLEHPLLFSLLDADATVENYLLLPDGGVGFRTLPALAPVPVEWHNELLQYLTAAVAGNSHRAMQMLSRICSGHNPYRVERLLLERLSALQPELRAHGAPPDSVVALENYWRVLNQTSLRPPLFLQLFHRNLSMLGQVSPAPSDAGVQPATPPRDVVSESLWPVLARLLQFRVGDILSTDKGQEWLAGSALLLLTALRQVGVMLEQVRDNDLAFELEGDPHEGREEKRNRRVASVIRSGGILVLFLFSLEMAQRTSGMLQIAAGSAAVLCAALVAILVARLD
jgi:hypothetical protein